MPQIGPYTIVRELARGGMGAVYLGQGPQGEQVAIKLILDAGLGDPESQVRFRREAEVLQSLQHPGILRVRGSGVDGGRPYMVMDLLSGPTLGELLKAEGPQPARRLIELGQAMASALAHAHSRGVVHRDLKPANVILRDGSPVLVDFGIVRMLGIDQSRLTETGALLGSPAFMAPEQADGSSDIGPAADVYALGATLYCLATGRPPFEGGRGLIALLKDILTSDPTPPRELRPDLDPALEGVILRCLAKEPAERYASAFALEQALARASVGTPRAATRRLPLVAAVVLAALVLAGLCATWWLAGESSTPSLPQSQAPRHAGQVEAQRPSLPEEALTQAGRNDEPTQVATSALDSKDLQSLLVRGQRLHDQGRYEEAIGDMDRVLQLLPESAPAYCVRGLCKELLGRHQEAIPDLEAAVRLNPEDWAALAALGDALRQLDRLDEALVAFDRALVLKPSNARSHSGRAEALERLGRINEAFWSHGTATKVAPSTALYFARRGYFLNRQNRFEEAIEDFNTSIDLDPSEAASYVGRGSARHRLNRLPEALVDYDTALKIAPDTIKALLNRGLARIATRQHAEAIADFDRALVLNPTLGIAYAERAGAKVTLGRYAEALDDWERAIEFLPPEKAELAREWRDKTQAALEQQR